MSPAGEYEILFTPKNPESTFSVDTQLPVFVSQILMLLSSLPLATCLPYGQKQTLKTSL
jgi:hypothetical protein